MTKLMDLVRLLRPHQWLKNAFVLTGLIFGHAWSDINLVYQVFAAVIAFCALSSSVYIVNDIVDREHDRLHETKKFRPLAAGKINVPIAVALAIVLAVVGLSIGFYIGIKLTAILIAYIVLNILYSFYLKNIVILDVFIISFGFMLRILAGTYGVGIPPSHWLMLCGLLLTLFLGFAKRRAEYTALANHNVQHRAVLKHYSTGLLDLMIGICASGTILSYSLYTMSVSTVQMHHSENLIYTVPFVIYGIFRYIYLLHNKKLLNDHDISSILLHDRQLVLTILGWFVVTVLLII